MGRRERPRSRLARVARPHSLEGIRHPPGECLQALAPGRRMRQRVGQPPLVGAERPLGFPEPSFPPISEAHLPKIRVREHGQARGRAHRFGRLRRAAERTRVDSRRPRKVEAQPARQKLRLPPASWRQRRILVALNSALAVHTDSPWRMRR